MAEERVAPAKPVINAVQHRCTRNAQHSEKSVINVVLRTFLVLVADPRRMWVKFKAVRIVENLPRQKY